MSSSEQFARRRGLNIRDALIFLVDFRVSMLRKDSAIDIAEDVCRTPGSSSLLSITLRCIADVMKTKIVARNADAVAVVVFGCRGPQARKGWPGVRLLRPLRAADAAGIKLLQRIAQRLEAGDADALLDMGNDELRDLPVPMNDDDFCFGPNEPVEFDKALWAVRHHFTAMAASRLNILHRKRVFVFTNDDDPACGNRAVKQLSLTQAKDLFDMGATLDISLLTSPSQMADTAMSEGPDSATFFNDLVYTEDDGGEVRGSVMIATIYSFDDLLTRVRRKGATKRAIRKTVLVLGNDYKIGIALYALVKKATRPLKVELAASTNKPVFKITTATCERVGEILKPEGIRYMFTPDYLNNTRFKTPGYQEEPSDAPAPPPPLVYGFKKSEVVKAKSIGPVGVVMYGYRKRSVLKREYTLSAPTFMFPDDTEYIGSTKAFACLLKCMLKKDVVGIASVRLSERSGQGMRFAALVPQQEELSDNAEKIVPGGFQLYYLPYKDDVYTSWRNEMKQSERVAVKEEDEEEEVAVKEEEMETAELNKEPESVSVARRMARNLKISEYSPRLFLNPDLQRFYAGLENAAGVESRYNPQDDLLNPDTDMMKSRGGHLAEEVKRLEVGADFDGDALAERFGTKSAKRVAEQSEKSLKRKAQKQAERQQAVENCDDAMFISKYQQGTLDKLLKGDLQIYCRAHGLNDKGTKKNLLVLVEDHIADNMAK